MLYDLYNRQQELNLSIPSSVTVVGCGGAGAWVAIACAMSGVQTLYLFDPDTLEESNRGRLPFCQSSINRPKVEVVRDFIMALRPDAIVVAIQDKLEGILLDIQLSVSEVFIECTDSPRAQFTIYKACQAAGRRFIRAGYDGTRLTVTSNVSGWIRTDVEEENYTINPSWVGTCLVLAGEVLFKLEKSPDHEVSLDLGEIGVPVVKRQRRLTARCNQTQATARRRYGR